MKFKLFSSFVILAMLLIAISPGSALAGAYESAWVSSITYQNIGTAATTVLNIYFYASPSDTAPLVIPRANLNSGASTSVYVGSLLPASFQGTAVMSADQPLAAVLVQASSVTAVKTRPLSNGFDAGTPQSMIASVFKKAPANTRFAVQNAGSTDTTVTIHFIRKSDAADVYQIVQAIKPGAGYHVDAGTLADGTIGATFDGSVVIDTAGGTGSIVSSAMELGTGTDNTGRAFEGVGQGSTTVYMPVASCNASGQTSYYAVQNTSLVNPTNVTVTYSNGAHKTLPVGPGAKSTFSGCQYDGTPVIPPGWGPGSATITSDTTDVVAIGKTAGTGWITAYIGFAQGASKVALPYVRWISDAYWPTGNYQRTYIAVQNISGFDIPAGDVRVTYIDQNGVVIGSPHILGALPDKAKLNSMPTNAGVSIFGYWGSYPTYTAGGGAIVEYTGGLTGVQLAVIARIVTYVNPTTLAGEDYSGIPMVP
jgi:hypothetical protein